MARPGRPGWARGAGPRRPATPVSSGRTVSYGAAGSIHPVRVAFRGEDDFALVADNFEPPTDDENVVRYDGSTPLDTWIDQTFSDPQAERGPTTHQKSTAEPRAPTARKGRQDGVGRRAQVQRGAQGVP